MMQKLALALALVTLAPALADAQPKTADEWYKEGEDQYNLGNFDAAVKAFQEGFRLEPNESRKAAYLYNIAQTYRQARKCRKAQFFFKRFIALKERDTTKPLTQKTRDSVDAFIRELDECARQEPEEPDPTTDAAASEPKPAPQPVVAVTPQPEQPDPEPDITATVDPSQPRLVSVRLVGGGAAISAGTLDIPLQATAALVAGYPIRLGDKLALDAGLGFTFTPVPYKDPLTMEGRSAALTAVVANAGITFEVIEKLGLRGDVGAGILVFSGVSESPFTKGAPTSGALTMPHVRVAISADYAITPNIVATATPFAFSYSPPKEGLREDITSITAIDFMLGIGYRM